MKIQYYCDSKPDPPYFYGIFSQKHCNKFSEFQALFLVLNGTAVSRYINFILNNIAEGNTIERLEALLPWRAKGMMP